MRLLIHICCASCAIEVVNEAKRLGYSRITGYFANPNIQPYSEFENRKKALLDYSESSGLKCHYLDYNPYDFFKALGAELEAPQRCYCCWQSRLYLSAEFAKKEGIDNFTTTLLISPYQSQSKIAEIGENIAREFGLNFISSNFRKFYSESRRKAKELKLYRQNYCGCIFSEHDRIKYQKSKNKI